MGAGAAAASVTYARADERDIARSLAAQSWCDPGPLMAPYQIGVPWTRTAMVSDREFRRSAFYNEVVRPLNGFYSVQVRGETTTAPFTVVLCRSPKEADFGETSMGLLKRLLPSPYQYPGD